jgi:hypothetical protein
MILSSDFLPSGGQCEGGEYSLNSAGGELLNGCLLRWVWEKVINPGVVENVEKGDGRFAGPVNVAGGSVLSGRQSDRQTISE